MLTSGTRTAQPRTGDKELEFSNFDIDVQCTIVQCTLIFTIFREGADLCVLPVAKAPTTDFTLRTPLEMGV